MIYYLRISDKSWYFLRQKAGIPGEPGDGTNARGISGWLNALVMFTEFTDLRNDMDKSADKIDKTSNVRSWVATTQHRTVRYVDLDYPHIQKRAVNHALKLGVLTQEISTEAILSTILEALGLGKIGVENDEWPEPIDWSKKFSRDQYMRRRWRARVRQAERVEKAFYNDVL